MAGMDTTFASEPSRRGLLRPLTTASGWMAVTHHLLGLPLGIVYFTWLVTGLSLGAGLAITLIGIPILTPRARQRAAAARGRARAVQRTARHADPAHRARAPAAKAGSGS